MTGDAAPTILYSMALGDSHPTQQSGGPGSRSALIVIFAVLLTVAVNVFWWLYYSETERQFAEQMDARLSTLVQAAAEYLTPAEVDSLAADDFETYAALSDYLLRLSGADTVSEIFVLGLDYHIVASGKFTDDTLYYLADLNQHELSAVFGAYAYDTIPDVQITDGYNTGNVILKTAFAPMFGSEGYALYVVGVEADVNYTESLAALKDNLTISTVISVVAAMIFAVLFLLIQRRMTRAERVALRSESEMNLGRMVAVVSHEIKNPLTILRSAAERIKKKTEMQEAQFLVEEVDRLNTIVTGYLDFARSPDKVALAYTTLEAILTNVREVCTQLRPRMEKDHVTLTTVLPPIRDEFAELTALIDPAALRQVLMNLMLNAADAAFQAATQEKGAREAEVRLMYELNNKELTLRVIDNGTGISEKAQKKLFEPFYTTKHSGSGLGLYLCKQLITRMHGQISVTSSEDGPTEFTVVLPVSTSGNSTIVTKSHKALTDF